MRGLTGMPHSVQRLLAPTGYAHAGHRPRLMRRQRRSAPGSASSSHRIEREIAAGIDIYTNTNIHIEELACET